MCPITMAAWIFTVWRNRSHGSGSPQPKAQLRPSDFQDSLVFERGISRMRFPVAA
jgi:hypothetical protein